MSTKLIGTPTEEVAPLHPSPSPKPPLATLPSVAAEPLGASPVHISLANYRKSEDARSIVVAETSTLRLESKPGQDDSNEDKDEKHKDDKRKSEDAKSIVVAETTTLPPESKPGQDDNNENEEDEEDRDEDERHKADKNEDILHEDLNPIDLETFQQILELDEEGGEFSQEMVKAFLTQAQQTFMDMDEALKHRDLTKLSSLGHFLKGSSAALGVSKVKDACEKIQHYGNMRDEAENKDLEPQEALDKITKLLLQVKNKHIAAEKWLKNYLLQP